MELLAEKPEASVWHATWAELLTAVPACDAVIVDAPYSKKTHDGHNEATATKNDNGCTDGFRALSYKPWGPEDVATFVGAWAPRTSSWMVSITDHVLAPYWAAEMERAGRYVFSPIVYVCPRGPRLAGDGPAQWATWIIVSRPKLRAFLGWGSLPGAYVAPRGYAGKPERIGGKQPWIMERLVADYSKPGHLVVDPCCGYGATLEAAIRTGRRCVGGDQDRASAEISASAINGMQQQPLFGGAA